ncbi:hypothetical protein [Gimesia aquarii]|uniref:Uncharacterized protein n=1 Tax=Gimesia aquarii TaxID=2527964 RepID=A0A517WYT1_9PLAN|nr:hypothetical protein [Gimesia aquarii]QDU10419.1 hypothetical protein V202x_38180 [Gimesia aquarii]
MTAKNAFLTVLLSIVGCAFLGGLGSLIVDSALPNYYATVFRPKESATIDPLILGIHLGLSQGATVGIMFALGVLALAAYRESHSQDQEDMNQPIQTSPTTRSWKGILLWISTTIMLVLFFCTITFVLGAIIAEQQNYQRQTLEKLEKLDTILETRMYPDLETDFSSAAQVYLTGTVPNQETHSALFQQLVQIFGTEEAEKIIRLVDVKETPK